MAYVELPFQPGTFPDDTALAAKGVSVATDKIRWVRNKAQTLGGNELASEDTFNGICRGMFSWRDNTGLPYCGIGTHTELDVYHDAEIFEITPIVARGQLSNPFTTSFGSAAITVSFVSHGLTSDTRISFPGQTTINGADISDDHGYEITVTGANGFTFNAGSAATSGGAGVGGTVNYDVYLAPGNRDGTGGAGYGTGAYGVGNYGSDNTTSYFARTWSFGSWGQNLLACPRGGGIYEWAPNFFATELVTNGDFASSSGWTTGTGWSITGGQAVATFGTASTLSTSVTLAPYAHFLLECDVTRTAGLMNIRFTDAGGSTIDIATSVNSSQHLETVVYGAAGGAATLDFVKDASFSGSLDNVTLTQLTTAQLVPGAPTENTCILVTPEQFGMAFGTIDYESGLRDPMGIRWSDTGRGDLTAIQDWEPSPENLSGGTRLGNGGRIVGARLGRGEILVWTDSSLYSGRYVSDTSVVYEFTLVAEGCGLIGPNAVTTIAGVAKWMSPAGEFFAYSGGSVVPLESTVRRDIFDHLAFVQQDKVSAFPVAAYGEAYFLYPDIRDVGDDGQPLNECSRYGSVNAFNQWANGFFDRTAWIDAGALPYPLAATSTGQLRFQEKGNSDNSAPLEWMRETGVIPIGNGTTLFGIRSFFPNVDDWLGGFMLTVRMSNFPNGPWTTYGPYAVAANALQVDLGPQFPTGKFAQFLIEGNSAPAFAREGVHMIDVYDTGMVF